MPKQDNWKNRIVGYDVVPADQLLANPANWRIHPKAQQDALTGVLDDVGWVQEIIVNKTTGHVVDGHMRVEVAITRGESVPVKYVELTEAEELLILATIDPISAMAATDAAQLESLLQSVNSDSAAVQAMLADLAERSQLYTGDNSAADSSTVAEANRTLAERFGVPPFSVLDARQGYWQERKRAWLALGLQSELGRDAFSSADARTFKNSKQSTSETILATDAPSIFDPVLCELAYRWFSPSDGSVLDPFAGGSVRGIVASKLGRKYTGIDLRNEQVEANKAQAKAIVPDSLPRWITGDSCNIPTLLKGEQYDYVFSCPPYFDLEIYSDTEGDLSNTGDYQTFLVAYRAIIAACVDRLRDNRFACFVVGDMRDKKGMYRNFVSDTIAAFQDAGASLYNEAILVTPVGTVMMQVSRNFPIGRKLGKTHQNVLVFIKGDPKKATAACGEVEVYYPDGLEGADEV